MFNNFYPSLSSLKHVASQVSIVCLKQKLYFLTISDKPSHVSRTIDFLHILMFFHLCVKTKSNDCVSFFSLNLSAVPQLANKFP